MFSVPSCFCFSSVGPAGPPGQIHLWLYGLHNISRKQNNHQTKHNPLLKLDLEQLRSSQIGKKGNADIRTTVCKVKDPKIPSLLFVSSVRSSYSHPDLLLITSTTTPLFQIHTGPQHWTFTF